MNVFANLCVGKPDTTPSKSAHMKGVREGNQPGSYGKEAGILPNGRVTARRSTSISPESKNPIDPRMPNLPPA